MLENNESDNYDDKYIEIRFNLDDKLPLKQELKTDGVV